MKQQLQSMLLPIALLIAGFGIGYVVGNFEGVHSGVLRGETIGRAKILREQYRAEVIAKKKAQEDLAKSANPFDTTTNPFEGSYQNPFSTELNPFAQ